MPEINDLLQKASTLLQAPIDSDLLTRGFSVGNVLSDAVRSQVPEYMLQPDYSMGDRETREGYILSTLGHISANPSDPERKRMLTEVYLYDRTDRGNADQEAHHPNLNAVAAKMFIDELVLESRRE